MNEMYELGYVLEHIQDFDVSDALFLPEHEKWNLKTKCMILDPDDVTSDEEEVPEQAKEKNLMYALNIDTIESIYENLYQQKKDCSKEDLLRAFFYYYDHDAYIIL